VPVNLNPVRPVLTDEAYRAMLLIAQVVGPEFALALVLARETGHRIGAISALRWSDVDLEDQLAVWRSESDKMGREHVTPLTAAAVTALRAARTRALGIADAPNFPADALTVHSARARWRRWWLQAERLAGLKHEPRFGWHSLRHAFQRRSARNRTWTWRRSAVGSRRSRSNCATSIQSLTGCARHCSSCEPESTNGEQTPELAM